MSTIIRTACTDCGWTGTPRGYRSRAQADYAYRRHSCDLTRRRRAAVERALAREAAIDHTPQPCPHGGRHQHGTYAAYTHDRCRCYPCITATAEYNAGLRRRHAYGQHDLIDATPVREHVNRLRDQGIGVKRVAALSGVSASTIEKLVDGTPTRPPSRKVRRATAARLLAVEVTPEALADGRFLDPTGTRRRLEALVALGWSINRLARDHGLDRQALDRALMHAPVQARTVEAVRAMYDAIGDARPPETTRAERYSAARARNLAEARGWVVPAMWDDADLDDPYAEPPSLADERTGVDLDEWAHLVRGGEDPARAARRCGVTWNAVEQAIKRGDRDDLRALLREARGGEAA